MWPSTRENLSSGCANNKGTDQSAAQRLCYSFFQEKIISKLATSEILFVLLFSVAEETDLSLALSETPKTGFVASKVI